MKEKKSAFRQTQFTGIRKVRFNHILVCMMVMLLFAGKANAQQKPIIIAEKFHYGLPDSTTRKIISSLDNLLSSIDMGMLDTTLVDRENYDFNRHFFTYLRGIEGKDTVKYHYEGQLINLYPIARSQYILTLAYLNKSEVGRIITIQAKEDSGKIVFANTIKYNTKGWKTSTIGTITIHYLDTFNVSRAEKLHHKNTTMATKLRLPVRNWEMYMCRHYQEVLQLQGYLYEVEGNGIVNSGYIVDPKTLFSVMSNEDFSHDLLHIYASGIRGKDRNIAECGLACLWGNSYHTDSEGNVPDLQDLIPVLQQYVKAHSDVKLLDLFEKNPDVLAEYGYPKPIQVKDIIGGLIWAEIEKQKGSDAVITFMKCGRGFDNLFKSTEALIGLNRENFDEKVYRLLFGV